MKIYLNLLHLCIVNHTLFFPGHGVVSALLYCRGLSVTAFRVTLGANHLNCVDVPLNPTHSLTHLFGIKIPTTKHEIMVHATSLKGGSRTSTNCVRVIMTAWDELDQRVIDTAVRQWRTRLRACVNAKAGQ